MVKLTLALLLLLGSVMVVAQSAPERRMQTLAALLLLWVFIAVGELLP